MGKANPLIGPAPAPPYRSRRDDPNKSLPVRENGLILSKTLLLLAVTTAAMRSRLALLLEAGPKPLIPVFAATLASFVTALTGAALMLD